MRCLPLLFMLFFSASHAVGQSEFSLAQALAYAEEHNMEARAKELDIADAAEQVKEYWAIGLPKLEGSVLYEHYFDIPTQILPDFITPSIDSRLVDYAVHTENVGILDNSDKTLPLPFAEGIPAQFGTANTLSWSLEAKALIFDGSFLVGLQAQRMYKELVATEMELTRRDIRLDIHKSYLSALIAKRNKEIINQNIDNLKKTLYEAEQTYKAGFIEKLDVDRLELSLQNLETESEQFDRLIEISKNILKFNMGFPMDEEILLTDQIESLLDGQQSEGMSQMDYTYEDRIEYDLLNRAAELNEINVKRLKVGYLPSLVGFASYGQSQLADRLFASGTEWYPTSVAGLGLSVPIFDANDKKVKIQRARISKEKVLLDRENFEAAMDLEVSNAQAGYKNAKEKVTNREKSLELARKIYDTTLIKYREGVGSSLEVTQAEQDLYMAQGNYTNALYDLLVSKVDLEKSIGKL